MLNRVLDEAARALNGRGVSHTSLPDIAQRIGVSRNALYHYFEDKEDLVFQCYRRSCEQMARRLNEARHSASDALDIIDAFIEGMLGEDTPEFVALSEAAYLRVEQRDTILGLYQGLRTSLADIIDKGVRRGELRPCRSGLVAPAIIGLISWVPAAKRWRTADPLSDQDLIRAIHDILHHGIAADGGEPGRHATFALAPLGLPAGRVFDAKAMAAARQEALLAAASWLFNLKGVDATSLDEIALRVGVTKKVIYHNMGGKDTLVAECYRRAFRFYEDIAARMCAYEGPRIDALTASAQALAEASLREDIAPLAYTGNEAWPEAEREALQASARRLMQMHLDAYAQGQAEGSVRELDARAVVTMHPGLFEWLPKWFDALDAMERAGAAQELSELYRLGLRPVKRLHTP